MEFGTIEREIHIEATPEVVYQVVSTPEHLKEWWPEEAELDPVPGRTGRARRSATGRASARRAAHRRRGRPAAPVLVPLGLRRGRRRGRGQLAAGDLRPGPVGAGTLLRFSEAGFREKGWEAAVLEEQYRDHVAGWDYFLPRLVAYAARLESAS